VALVGLLAGCLLLVAQLTRVGWEPTAPFVVGTSWGLDEELAARHVAVELTPGNGYDGQWFLGLAHDPLLSQRLAASFDMPRYRAGRPLQAVAGWLLAGGQAGVIPLGLLAVGPLAVALGSAATGRLVAAFGRSPWWGLGFALVPGVVALGLWSAYVAWRIPPGAGDGEAAGAVGPPLAGWAHALGLVAGGDYVPDAPVGPLGAVLLVGSLVVAVTAIVLGLRRPTLLGATGLLLGLYGLLLSGELLGRFLSSMRALAPTVLAAGLAIAAGTMGARRARPPGGSSPQRGADDA
jgi:hypothetical protein